MNNVHMREAKAYPGELKGSRYAQFKKAKARGKTQEEVFKAIQEVNLEIRTAWRFREDCKAIFQCTFNIEALQRWLCCYFGG